MPLCVRFLRTGPRGFLFHRVRGRRTPEVGTGAQCAVLSPLPRARRLVTGSSTACRVDFVFPRRRLTHLCRKPRVPRWWLHTCVRSCASGQHSNSYRSLRPNWPFESAKLHVVVAVVGWSRSMVARVSFTLSSTKPTIEVDELRRRPRRDSHGSCRLSGVYSHLLGQDGTACQWATRRAAGYSCLHCLDFQAISLPCEDVTLSFST